MLRWLSLLITLPVTVAVVLFAVSNRNMVSAELFPLPFTLEAPFYLYVLVAIVVGLLTGSAVTWIYGHNVRATARREAKRAAKLEKELIDLRAVALRSDAPPPSGGSSAYVASGGSSLGSAQSAPMLPLN